MARAKVARDPEKFSSRNEGLIGGAISLRTLRRRPRGGARIQRPPRIQKAAERAGMLGDKRRGGGGGTRGGIVHVHKGEGTEGGAVAPTKARESV